MGRQVFMHVSVCASSFICLSPRICALMSPLAPFGLLLLTCLSVVSLPLGPEKGVALKDA